MADKIKKAKKQMVDSKTGKPIGKSETVVLTKSSVNEAFKKGGTVKTKMKTGGMVNPNKKATVTTKATKYTGGKNGTMMKGKGTKKK